MSTKELTATDRARKALATVATEATMNALATRYTDLTVVKDKPDLSLAMSALGELRSARVEIQRVGKAARDDANAFSKAVIAEEKRLIQIISPEESRIKELRETYEAEIERQRAEKARIEAERIAGIRARIARFHDAVTAAANGPAYRLVDVIDKLSGVQIGEEYAELAGEAKVSLDQAKKRADDLLDEAVAREQAEAERKAREHAEAVRREQAESVRKAREAAEAEARRKEKEELDRQRAEQARITAELKAQQEAIERASREAEAKAKAEQARIHEELRAQRKAMEKDRIEAEAKALAEHKERERQAVAERAKIERERRELAERQAEIERWEHASSETEKAAQERKADKDLAAQEQATPRPETLEEEIEDWGMQFGMTTAGLKALWVILSRHGFTEKETDNA